MGLSAERTPASDSWLAIVVATAPDSRAAELRTAWERFMARFPAHEPDAGNPTLRTRIVDSADRRGVRNAG